MTDYYVDGPLSLDLPRFARDEHDQSRERLEDPVCRGLWANPVTANTQTNSVPTTDAKVGDDDQRRISRWTEFA